MEALSGVASGMAVASLSIQLIESINKIKTLIRNVKNAPNELIRLNELLERLGALVEDVRDVLGQQQSSPGHPFPTPSMTIFNCLKGCESSLQPLNDLVETHEQSQSQMGSAMTKIKGNIKFALKVKDIAGFENRIQQDVNYLTNALVLNQTKMIMQAPAIMFAQMQTSTTVAITAPKHQRSVVAQSPREQSDQSSYPSAVRFSQRMSWVSSRLQWIGLRQQKISRIMHVIADAQGVPTDTSQEIISEHDVYSWASTILGHGISWSMYSSHGQILPSLSVYPVVEDFYDILPTKTLENASILEVQQWFATNTIHPFTRDKWDRNLLHQTARFYRDDISRLLLGYGVRQEISSFEYSPFLSAFDNLSFDNVSGQTKRIDTFRVLLQDPNFIENFDRISWYNEPFLVTSYEFYDLAWLWNQSSSYFVGAALLDFQKIIFRALMGILSSYSDLEGLIRDKISHSSLLSMISEFRQEIEAGRCMLLWALFLDAKYSCDSFIQGSALIMLLTTAGVDFQICIMKELENIPDRILSDSYLGDRKIIFECNEDEDWILGWEWHWSAESPCLNFFSEFSALAGEDDNLADGPFFFREGPLCGKEFEEIHRKLESRFHRRVAAKGRKERAKAGQKIQRSKMPGTWNW